MHTFTTKKKKNATLQMSSSTAPILKNISNEYSHNIDYETVEKKNTLN